MRGCYLNLYVMTLCGKWLWTVVFLKLGKHTMVLASMTFGAHLVTTRLKTALDSESRPFNWALKLGGSEPKTREGKFEELKAPYDGYFLLKCVTSAYVQVKMPVGAL